MPLAGRDGIISFLSTALPIVIAVLFGIWANNKGLDAAPGKAYTVFRFGT
jgi:hypothetical protein